jgi:myo-inositol-1(or 4)-monophosphatase
VTVDVSTRHGLEAVLPVARDAAREAGSLVQRGYRRDVKAEHKGVVDLVTEFDRESETLLRQRLAAAFPFPIVGEEGGGAFPAEGPVFCIDPLDGTTNFVHGHPFWCVSIGLLVSGAPVLGVVVSPPLGIEWYGWNAEGTGERRAARHTAANAMTRASRADAEDPCRISTTSSLDDALLATGFPYDRRTSADNNFAAFVALKKRAQGVRRCGSAAIDLCLVSDGTYDGYWERKLHPWDVAGGAAIVRAAGGRVTDFEGGTAFVASGRVVATNGVIHDALLGELARVATASITL